MVSFVQKPSMLYSGLGHWDRFLFGLVIKEGPFRQVTFYPRPQGWKSQPQGRGRVFR